MTYAAKVLQGLEGVSSKYKRALEMEFGERLYCHKVQSNGEMQWLKGQHHSHVEHLESSSSSSDAQSGGAVAVEFDLIYGPPICGPFYLCFCTLCGPSPL